MILTLDTETEKLAEILEQCGQENKLAQGDILIRQGTESDGVYYLKRGRLGVYREEMDTTYLLAEIEPGETVGELGAATGHQRTATVKAEIESWVIHVSEQDFRRVLEEAPALMAEVICTIGDRLTNADVVMVTLNRSYQQAVDRVQALRTEKEQLEEILRLREELANMIVHDLRNPLGVISNGIEFLKRLSGNDPKAEYVDSVVQAMEWSTRRMRHLVDTLLDIARLEAGDLLLHRIPIELHDLIQQVVSEELPMAENYGIAIETHFLPESLIVLADRGFLQRVLINLLDNALKFSSSTEPIQINVHTSPDLITVQVIDNGPGVPVEERERVFEKFTQVCSIAGKERGAGLGLAFCRMAVEAHGGHIWVEDNPTGEGSCFTFTLPHDVEIVSPSALAGDDVLGQGG